jgi:hypothetical protein
VFLGLSSVKTPTITWGASATLAPLVVAARRFYLKVAHSLSAIYSQLQLVKNLSKTSDRQRLLAPVDNHRHLPGNRPFRRRRRRGTTSKPDLK